MRHTIDPTKHRFISSCRAVAVLLLLVMPLSARPAMAEDAAAQRLLREAEQQLAAGAVEAARGSLELFLRQFPTAPGAATALQRLAEAYRSLGDTTGARRMVDRLLAEHPRSAQTAMGMLLSADVQRDEARGAQDLEAARISLRRIPLLFARDAFPGLSARHRAMVLSGEISLALGEPDAAAADFLAVLEGDPSVAESASATIGLARAWLASGEWQIAAHELERLLATSDAPSADRNAARRLLGLMHRRQIRALGGLPQWSSSGRFQAPGLDLRQPAGVAAAAELLVVDEKLPAILRLGADGRETQRVALSDVTRPGILGDGRPFVVTSGGVMLPFDATTWAFSEPGRDAPLRNLTAAAGGVFGDWYLLDKGGRGLIHVDRDGRSRQLLTERANLSDLAVGPGGRVHVLDGRAGQILRLGIDGGLEGVALSGSWRRPVGLEIDALGYFYVLDRAEKRVELYSSDGHRLADIGPTLGGGVDLRNPVDLAVDDSGRLFIADTRLPFLVMLD